MKLLIMILILIITACGGGEDGVNTQVVQARTVEPVSVTSTPTNNDCTWWRQPNQEFNGVPKYSGSFCTYTHKHIPLAVYGNNAMFYTTTTLVYHGTNLSANGDVGADTDFLVYAHKDNTKQLVHKIEHWTDPHTNAAIQIDNDGHVNVHIASRGLSFKFQSGKHVRSQTPYQLDFQCVSGCSAQDINFEAYPQVFDTSFGYYVGYTHYVKDPAIHPTRNIREIWYRIGNTRTRIAKGAHYQNTYYHNGWVYVAFNWLKEGDTEQRHNLYVIKTNDGINWKTTDNIVVNLPLDEDHVTARVHETESIGRNVYLKDLTWHVGPRVLFTESTTNDPTQGQRWVREWWKHNEPEVITVTETNHNYSAGAYVKYDDNLYVLANGDSSVPYLGGDVEVYKVYIGAYGLQDALIGGNYSYIRKVYGVDGKAVAGEGFSDVYVTSEHVVLELDAN